MTHDRIRLDTKFELCITMSASSACCQLGMLVDILLVFALIICRLGCASVYQMYIGLFVGGGLTRHGISFQQPALCKPAWRQHQRPPQHPVCCQTDTAPDNAVRCVNTLVDT